MQTAIIGHHRRILLAITGRQAAYATLVALHVVAALAGFGGLALTGVYAASARHLERPGVEEELTRYFGARGVAERALLTVPVLGVAATLVDPHGKGLVHPWIGAALLLWGAALLVVALVARPATARLRAALFAGKDISGIDPVAAAAAGSALRWAALATDLIFVVAVLDMLFRPG